MPNRFLKHVPYSGAGSARPKSGPETILATIQARLEFTEPCQKWLAQAHEHQLWLARNGGKFFFTQFRTTWEQTLIEASTPLVRQHFLSRGVLPDRLPRVKIHESSDHWTIAVAVAVKSVAGPATAVQQEQTAGQRIAAELARFQARLDKDFTCLANQRAHEHLCFPTVENLLPRPPQSPFAATIRIGC